MTPEDIQTEYERLGFSQGWRFLTGPARNLTTARLAFQRALSTGSGIQVPWPW